LWLARALAAAGVRVAIVLRGYRGDSKIATVVSRGDGPEVGVDQVGDEAVMLAKCFPGVVVVAPRRVEGVTLAEGLGSELVVLDDGFQHRALARDVDLVLVSGRDGSLLPAGPMRERPGALRRATAVVRVRKSADEPLFGDDDIDVPATVPCFVARFAVQGAVVSDAGVWHEVSADTIAGRRVAVVSGIANPGPFYASVRQWDAHIEEIFEYPDHYRYTTADWQQLSRDTRLVDVVVTTEKDLVKLEGFPFARRKLVALRVVPEVEGGDELVRLVLAKTGLLSRDTAAGGPHGNQ